MTQKERPMSVSDARQQSLLRPEPKQTLAKEVVSVRSYNDEGRRFLQAAKKVAAGESLYLSDLAKERQSRG